MKLGELLNKIENIDVGVALKFYGRAFFGLLFATLFVAFMVKFFMAAPLVAIITTTIVLSALAWLVGEILTAEDSDE